MEKDAETCKIQDTSEDEEKRDKKESRIREWLMFVVATLESIAVLFNLGWDVYKDIRDQRKEYNEEQKEEISIHPCFAMRRGGTVPVGLEDWYKMYLENSNNEIDIASGTFGMEYLVVVEYENEKAVLSWEKILLQPEVEYDNEYDGCYFLINDDFYACEWKTQQICLESGLEDIVCSSYIFFYFDYEHDGQKDEVYYLVEMTEERWKGAIEVKEPDEYKESILMSL